MIRTAMNIFINPDTATSLFWWSFLFYSIACACYIVYLVAEKKRISKTAFVMMTIAFTLQTMAITSRSLYLKRLPLTNMFEFISTFAWVAAIFYFVVLKIYKQNIIGAFIGPVIFMLMVIGSLLPKQPELTLVPALQSNWLIIHVSIAILAEAAFAIGFAVNIMHFIKSALSDQSKFGNRLPDLRTLDLIGYKAVAVGYPLFTVGALFAGAIWAEQAWGRFWGWDPKEVCSLIVWLVYTIYLHARHVKGWTGNRAALLSAFGFICTILTFFANTILGGLHAYN